MFKQIKKNKITIREYIKRSLILSSIYFIVLTVWQLMIYIYNNEESNMHISPLALVLFLFIFVLWFLCYFEIRTVTKNEERFLGYKSYIIFFLKLLLAPVAVFITLLIGINSNLIIYPILGSCGICSIYYICFFVLLHPYKAYVKDNIGELYISYQIRVKKWYIEGTVI